MRIRVVLAVLAAGLLAAPPAAAAEVDRLPSGVAVAREAPALPDGITASSWLVADLETGAVLAAKDAHGRYAPASTLKTLTALALAPRIADGARVVPTYEDVAVEGSKVGLLEGVGYPKDELLSALMMVSGNDAANALATAVGGQAAAARLMNDTAKALGARDTRAVNPHGLDAEGQTSSAYDLALIARAGMQDADFRRWSVTRKATMTGKAGERFEIYNHNKLLANYEGALGIKNGYTSRARASFVGAAERDGRTLVVTLMKAEPRVWAEAIRLLDWGFSAGAVRPVGQLVEPAAEEPAVEEAAEEVAAAVTSAGRAAAVVDEQPARWPAVLGGLALALAAVAAVRHDPPVRPSGVPAQRVPAPAAARRPEARPAPVRPAAPAPPRAAAARPAVGLRPAPAAVRRTG